MYNILTLDKISANGLSFLPKDSFEISNNTDVPDGVILRSFSMHDMELPKSLKAIARAGAGTNNIPIDKCSEKGIVVFNTPGANANAVKELVVASLLISSRKIVDGINWVQGLKNETGVAKLVEKGKSSFVGPEIMGKKLGVVGLGAIGILVANACNGLGMDVYGYDPFVSVDAAWTISKKVHKAVSLEEIYENCDYITIHVPFNAETKGMICEESIAKMKDGVRIINLSRGELANEEDIKKAVESNKVGCYVTDFPTENILGVKNIITVPHLGASSPESEENCASMAAQEIKDFLENGNIKNSVNFPNCDLGIVAKKRICVTHKNIPNIISALTAGVAAKNINIDNMINKSKGDFAYTIIDVDQNDISGAEVDFEKIDGVIGVRII